MGKIVEVTFVSEVLPSSVLANSRPNFLFHTHTDTERKRQPIKNDAHTSTPRMYYTYAYDAIPIARPAAP